jgi:hypothetical protein
VLASAAGAATTTTAPEVPVDPAGVLAVSATHLQGFEIPPAARSFYSQLRKREPFAILGGSIYLFDLAPTE